MAAFVVVVVVRAFLAFLPLRFWERVTERLRHRRSVGTAAGSALDVARAVRRVSRVVPGATCLTQALAARLLLSRYGYPAHLQIGVVRTPEGELRAHAWLESEGRVVLGAAELEGYTPLNDASPSPTGIGDERPSRAPGGHGETLWSRRRSSVSFSRNAARSSN